MKKLIAIVMISTSLSATGQNGKANTTKKTFSRATSISEVINCNPATVWVLLTNVDDFARWNSTIVSIEGAIELGKKIKLVSTLDTSRTFKLKVKEFIPNQKLVWGDAMGQRIYTLQQKGNSTIFTMTEKIGSFMFPLFANKIPSFDTSFEQFTADLKREAESNTK